MECDIHASAGVAVYVVCEHGTKGMPAWHYKGMPNVGCVYTHLNAICDTDIRLTGGIRVARHMIYRAVSVVWGVLVGHGVAVGGSDRGRHTHGRWHGGIHAMCGVRGRHGVCGGHGVCGVRSHGARGE